MPDFSISFKTEPSSERFQKLEKVSTSTLRADILDEKVMSAIVEMKVRIARAEEIIHVVWSVEKRLDTVVALGLATLARSTEKRLW